MGHGGGSCSRLLSARQLRGPAAPRQGLQPGRGPGSRVGFLSQVSRRVFESGLGSGSRALLAGLVGLPFCGSCLLTGHPSGRGAPGARCAAPERPSNSATPHAGPAAARRSGQTDCGQTDCGQAERLERPGRAARRTVTRRSGPTDCSQTDCGQSERPDRLRPGRAARAARSSGQPASAEPPARRPAACDRGRDQLPESPIRLPGGG